MHACDPAPGWFRDHFNEDYRTIYLGRGPEDADREVWLVSFDRDLLSSDLVLDLCCGYGRHMLGFARRGVRAVGVDLSRPLLRQGACEIGGRPLLVCADMRDLPFEGGARGFSVVVNFFTSFVQFKSDEQNLQVACEIRRVLRPGGRFAIDLMNADSTIRDLEPRSERVAVPTMSSRSARTMPPASGSRSASSCARQLRRLACTPATRGATSSPSAFSAKGRSALCSPRRASPPTESLAISAAERTAPTAPA